jgi:hypothetical protein
MYWEENLSQCRLQQPQITYELACDGNQTSTVKGQRLSDKREPVRAGCNRNSCTWLWDAVWIIYRKVSPCNREIMMELANRNTHSVKEI